jgi:hypothetical protein
MRRTARRRAADGAALEADLDLDGGVAAGVEYLACLTSVISVMGKSPFQKG